MDPATAKGDRDGSGEGVVKEYRELMEKVWATAVEKNIWLDKVKNTEATIFGVPLILEAIFTFRKILPNTQWVLATTLIIYYIHMLNNSNNDKGAYMYRFCWKKIINMCSSCYVGTYARTWIKSCK